ncbi:unnamed protein product [Gordionus sp. m RMFG-2023]
MTDKQLIDHLDVILCIVFVRFLAAIDFFSLNFNPSFYLLLDSGTDKNEEIVGEALEIFLPKFKLKREDIFMISKLGIILDVYTPNILSSNYIDDCLHRLRLKYVDLYVIHPPSNSSPKNSDSEEMKTLLAIWKSLAVAVKEGKIRSLGVSNFNKTQLETMFNFDNLAKFPPASMTPSVNQISFHPRLFRNDIVEYCHSHGAQVQAMISLDSPACRDLLLDKTLLRLGKNYSKTTDQILLRWALQRGLMIMLKYFAYSKPMIDSNINIFDFEITASDMQIIDSLNK